MEHINISSCLTHKKGCKFCQKIFNDKEQLCEMISKEGHATLVASSLRILVEFILSLLKVGSNENILWNPNALEPDTP